MNKSIFKLSMVTLIFISLLYFLGGFVPTDEVEVNSNLGGKAGYNKVCISPFSRHCIGFVK